MITKTYIPIKASEVRRPYGTGRVLVRMSFSRQTVRNMDSADLGDGNQSAFVEFGTRMLLALMETDLTEREAREVRMLLLKMTETGFQTVLSNVEKIFDVQRRP